MTCHQITNLAAHPLTTTINQQQPCSFGLSATSQQYFFSQNKPDTSNQPALLFSQNKSAPAISQTNRLNMHDPTVGRQGRRRYLSVRNVVPTLTSNERWDLPLDGPVLATNNTGFILVPAGAVRPTVVCSGHYIASHRGARRGGYKRGGRGGQASESQRYWLRQVPISWW
jgi:hypothetical protein